MNKVLALAVVSSLMLAGASCDTANDSPGTDAPTTGEPTAADNPPGNDAPTTGEPSVAYKLAVVHGDPSTEGAFQEVLDCVEASGIEGAETEEQIGDTLVASWEQSAQRESLLEWAQAFC